MLEALVEEMVREHGGGTRFFDSLDHKLRTNAIACGLTVMANALFGPKKVVVTGKFGERYAKKFYPTLVLPSLRGDDWEVEVGDYVGDYVLLDDSFYSGRTFQTADLIIGLGGGKLVGAVVAYDGSPVPWANVYSMYRWRDRRP